VAPALLFSIVITMVGSACSDTGGAGAAPRLASKPCPPADNIGDGLCAELEVFEDHEVASGRRIRLRVF
jgi:hypothetical protein